MRKIAIIAALMLIIPAYISYGFPNLDTQDEAYGVAVDSKGNVIVVGQHYDGSKYVMRVQKYDGESGNIVWQTDFDEFATNIGKAVAVGSDGYIYAGGIVGKEVAGIPIPSTDFVIVKYDSNGNRLMYETYNNGFADFLMDMGVDEDGYVYATGMTLYIDVTSANLTNIDYWTIKVNPNNLKKVAEDVFDYDLDAAFGMDVRGMEIVVAGTVQSGKESKFCVIKYNQNLEREWVRYYYENKAATASDAAILPDGKIAVTGNEFSNNVTIEDFKTVLYDANGNELWDRKETSDEKDDALSVAADSKGNIVVAGYRTLQLHKRWYLLKYDKNGNVKWELQENIEGEIKRIAIDDDNNIIAAGYKIEGGEEKFCIKKYSPDGDEIWTAKAENPPEPTHADFIWQPEQPTRNQIVHFYDKSTGDIISWHWDFGDGSESTQQNPLHQYTSIGTFNVTLTIQTTSGSDSVSKKITVVNAVPQPRFSYKPSNPLEGEEITFDASESYDSDGSIITWHWDFGDGNTSNGEIVNHVYTKAGTYKVMLTVTDNDGASESIYKYITVNSPGENIPPVASFEATKTVVVVNEEITFDASESYDSDGSIVFYRWDWNGDGIFDNEYTQPYATHSFSEAGEYTVTLQVEDNNGSVNTYSVVIKVLGEGENPRLLITLGVSNIAPIKEGEERTIPIEVFCYNFTATNVRIVVVDNANLSVSQTSPSITIKHGEEKKILIKVKVPKLGGNVTAGTKTIKVKAVCDEGIESNVEEIEIVIHKGGGMPSFTLPLFIIAGIAAMMLLRRKRK